MQASIANAAKQLVWIPRYRDVYKASLNNLLCISNNMVSALVLLCRQIFSVDAN